MASGLRPTAALVVGLAALAAAAWAWLAWEPVSIAGISASERSALTGPDASQSGMTQLHLAWILGLTLLVVAEKSLPSGQRLARRVGWLLLAWAAWRAIAWLAVNSSP